MHTDQLLGHLPDDLYLLIHHSRKGRRTFIHIAYPPLFGSGGGGPLKLFSGTLDAMGTMELPPTLYFSSDD